MKKALFVNLLATAMLFAAPIAGATVIHLQTILSGPNEAPPNASPGTGFATVDLDDVLHTVHVHAEFSGLIGNTTASHIHCCTAAPGTGTAGVATTIPFFVGFPIGVTSGVFDSTLDLLAAGSYNPSFIAAHGGTPASADAALEAGMLGGKSYFNIHTTFRPGGEIRGFLVPEPATITLLALGLGAGLVSLRRRRTL